MTTPGPVRGSKETARAFFVRVSFASTELNVINADICGSIVLGIRQSIVSHSLPISVRSDPRV